MTSYNVLSEGKGLTAHVQYNIALWSEVLTLKKSGVDHLPWPSLTVVDLEWLYTTRCFRHSDWLARLYVSTINVFATYLGPPVAGLKPKTVEQRYRHSRTGRIPRVSCQFCSPRLQMVKPMCPAPCL